MRCDKRYRRVSKIVEGTMVREAGREFYSIGEVGLPGCRGDAPPLSRACALGSSRL